MWGGVISYSLTLLVLIAAGKPVTALNLIEWLVCALLGSLYPDIDTKSKGQWLFYRIIVIMIITCLLYGSFTLLACISVMSLLPILVRHRGIFHKPWFILFTTLLFYFLVVTIFPGHKHSIIMDCLFFLIGALSHVWLDKGFKALFQ